MWKIYKNDSEDLAFSLDCLFNQSITLNEFKLWLEIVLQDMNIESLPDYFFDLMDFDQGLFHIINIIGFVPHSKLSEEEEKSLIGIAYLRNARSLYDIEMDKNTAIQKLKKYPDILKKFNRFFPFIKIDIDI